MLEGVKVLSFTHYLQGPSAAQALADLGADVVKVESCRGAYERGWSGCNTYKNGVSVFYLMANRNQRGVALDLKSDEGTMSQISPPPPVHFPDPLPRPRTIPPISHPTHFPL